MKLSKQQLPLPLNLDDIQGLDEAINNLEFWTNEPIYNYLPKLDSTDWYLGDLDETGNEISSNKCILLAKKTYYGSVLYKLYNSATWYVKTVGIFRSDLSLNRKIEYTADLPFVTFNSVGTAPYIQVVIARVDNADITEEDIKTIDLLLMKEGFGVLAHEYRDFTPANVYRADRQGIFSFVDISSIVDVNIYGKYGDAIVLDTWTDKSGGKINAIVTCKAKEKMLLLQGSIDSNVWETVKEIVLSDTGATPVLTNAIDQNIAGIKNFARAAQHQDSKVYTSYGRPSIWESVMVPAASVNQIEYMEPENITLTASYSDTGEDSWDAPILNNTTTTLKRLVGGTTTNSHIRVVISDADSTTVDIKRVAVTITASSYCWFNDLVMLGSMTRGTWKAKVQGQVMNSTEWVDIITDETISKSAEFLLHISHPTVQFHPTTTGANRYFKLRLVFYDFKISDFNITNSLVLWKFMWFGSYPSLLRGPLKFDENKNAIFDGNVQASNLATKADLPVSTKVRKILASMEDSLIAAIDNLEFELVPLGIDDTSGNTLQVRNTGASNANITWILDHVYNASGTLERKSGRTVISAGSTVVLETDIASAGYQSHIKLSCINQYSPAGYDILISVPSGWISRKLTGAITINKIF